MLRKAEIRNGHLVTRRYVEAYFILREIAAWTAYAA
jgi:hypothetical protein